MRVSQSTANVPEKFFEPVQCGRSILDDRDMQILSPEVILDDIRLFSVLDESIIEHQDYADMRQMGSGLRLLLKSLDFSCAASWI